MLNVEIFSNKIFITVIIFLLKKQLILVLGTEKLK